MTNISSLNNKRIIHIGTKTILRLKNTDFDTYDYYFKGQCFLSFPIVEGFLKGDKMARITVNTLY